MEVINRMAVFEVNTYVVIHGKESEHELILKEIFDYGRKHPEISKHVKSLRVFRQGVGGSPIGRFVLMTEFENLCEMEVFYTKLNKDKDWLKIREKWISVIDLGSMYVSLWIDRLRDFWVERC